MDDEYDDEIFDGIFNADLIDYETWEREAGEDELSVDLSEEEETKE